MLCALVLPVHAVNRRGPLLAALAAALLAGAPAAPAGAAYPGTNGQVAFVGQRLGSDVLYLRAGHRIRGLLKGGVMSGPAFSPRGVRIAVTRELPDEGRAVWILQADGRDLRRLTAPELAGAQPTWAPGGRLLAYAAGPTGARRIHRIGADGVGDVALTAGPADQHDPAWSTRGVIAFVQANPSGEDIYTVPADGGTPRRLTSKPGDDADPAWSPRGDRLAFVRGRGGIWVMNAYGRAARRVVHVRGGIEQGVAWSPDGRRLLFAGGPPGARRIYSVRPDGKGLRALTLPSSNGRDPDWQSAGHDPLIAAAGDIACDPAGASFNGGFGRPRHCGQLRTSNLLLRADLSAVLVAGDLQYPDGDLGRFYGSFHPSWGRVKSLLRPVPGNHEYGRPGAADYFAYFNGRGASSGPAGSPARGGYYSFDIGAWHVVALNSNCARVPGGCGEGSPQQQWLADDLRAHRNRCTLAFWHHALFSSLARAEGRGSKQTEELWQTLYDHGADVVITGHQHFYERFPPQDRVGGLDMTRGLREFVVGTGGKSIDRADVRARNSAAFNDTTFGVLELELHPRSYSWQFVSASADPFTDSGTALCH